VAEAIHRLVQFATHLRTDVSRIDVWRPTRKELECLEFVLGLAEVEQVRMVLLESSSTCAPLSKFMETSLSASGPKDSTGAGTYRSASAELTAAAEEAAKVGQSGPARERLDDAWRAMSEFIESRIVGPLAAEALSAASPGDRAAGLMTAELCRAFFVESAAASASSPPLGCRSVVEQQALERRIEILIKLARSFLKSKK
jgi:hypothetical protein